MKKKLHNPSPIIIKRVWTISQIYESITKLPQSLINEYLRERGIGIPQYKHTAAMRLAKHMANTRSLITITIG